MKILIAGLLFSSLLVILPAPYLGHVLLGTLLLGGIIYAYQQYHRWLDVWHRLTPPPYLCLSKTQAGILSFAAVLFSAYVLDPTASDRPAILALPAVIIGGAAFWVVMRNQTVPAFIAAEPQAGRIRFLPLTGGILLLAILAEINGNLLHIEAFQQVSSHLQFTYLFVGCLFMVWGLAGELPRVRCRALLTYPTLGILLITALALILRLWQLEDAIRVFVDETNFTNIIMRFVQDDNLPLLLRSDDMFFNFPHLFAYFQLGGVNWIGHTLAGARLASVVFGVLTIPAVYLLGRNLFNIKIGLIAALLLATFPPHLQFSRLGMNNIADPLFGVLALAFLARGLRTGRRLDYVLGGTALGLTQYFYEGGRLLFPAVFLMWLGYLVITHRRQRRLITCFVLVACFVALPLYYAWGVQGLSTTPRLDIVVDFNLPLPSRILVAFLVYVHLPEAPVSIYYYGGRTAMMLPYLVPFFLIGGYYSIWQATRRGGAWWLFPLWLGVAALGNSLLIVPNMYARYVTVFPALTILLAIGIDWVLAWLTGIRKRVVLLVVVIGIAAWQTVYYFGPQLEFFNFQYRQYIHRRDGDDALLRALDFPAGTYIHFIGIDPPDEMQTQQKLLFLDKTLRVDMAERNTLSEDYLQGLSQAGTHLFFIDAGDDFLLALLQKYFDLEAGPPSNPIVPENKRYDLYYTVVENDEVG